MLTLGVIARSRKENERRLPIHPDHFDLVPRKSRTSIRFERGYGEPFGISDTELERRFAGTADRSELLGRSHVVLLPKPLPEDLQGAPGGRHSLGLAALRPAARDHPDRDRPQADADRLGGDVLVEPRRARDARVRSQQRDGGVLRRDSRAGPHGERWVVRRTGRGVRDQPRLCEPRSDLRAPAPGLPQHPGVHPTRALGRARQDPGLPLRAIWSAARPGTGWASSRTTAPAHR